MMREIVIGRRPDDLEKYGSKATGYLGKNVIGEGEDIHLANKMVIDLLRPHLILIAGKRGSGKCVEENTLIMLDDGSQIPIKRLKNNTQKIYSINENLGISLSNKVNFFERKVKLLNQIVLESGRSIKLTPEHPLLTINGWIEAKKLSLGAKIAVPKKLHIEWDEITEIKEFSGDFKVCDITVPKYHNFVANDIIVHNSYSGGIIIEEMALLPEEFRKNLTSVVIDTMGIYWSTKLPNDDQIVLLDQWGLKPKGLADRTRVFVPFSQKKEFEAADIPVDFGISIPPFEFSAEEWSLAFQLPMTNPISLGLQKIVNMFHERSEKFSIDDLVSKIKDDRTIDTRVKSALDNMISVAAEWGVFGEEGVKIDEVMKPGMINVFDVSRLRVTEAWSVRNLLVALIARKIYEQRVIARKQEELVKIGVGRKKERFPMVWLVIDEAHNFCPSDFQTVSTQPILTIVKQGREPGISFVPMTQMPNKLHQDIISQADIVISHRLTSKNDLDALHTVMQTYLMEDITKSIDAMPKSKGSAIVLDDNSERIYTMQVRPRFSWHAGEAAIATT